MAGLPPLLDELLLEDELLVEDELLLDDELLLEDELLLDVLPLELLELLEFPEPPGGSAPPSPPLPPPQAVSPKVNTMAHRKMILAFDMRQTPLFLLYTYSPLLKLLPNLARTVTRLPA